MGNRAIRISVLASVLLATAAPVLAYAGPGAGLSMIGSLLALVGAVLAALFGFIWFPAKRLLRQRKAAQIDAAAAPIGPDDAPR